MEKRAGIRWVSRNIRRPEFSPRMELELMENDILESLEDLGYKGPLLEDGALALAASGGATSPEYTKLCAWLVSELRLFCKLEENVQATNSPSEADEFQLEVSGLLGEMNCPYTTLTSGDVTKRLLNQKNCLLLLTYLISELEAARMLYVNAPPKKAQEGTGSELKETLAKVPSNHVGKPLLSKPMGPVHWEKIEAINQAIANEYEVRRKLLVKRLDVTVQSFGWSDRAKSQTEKLAKVYQPKRAILSAKSAISVAHLLAARQDLSKIMRTSSGSIREKTACAINKCLTEVGDPMKSSHLHLRCHHGRKGKMVLNSKVVAEVEEVVMSHHMEGVEAMTKGVMTEEAEEDMTKEVMKEEVEEGMTPMETEEVMNTGVMNEAVDVVAMTMVAEGEEEEANLKVAGPMVEEVAIKMSIGIIITEILDFKLVVTMVVAVEVATKEADMVVTNHHIQEVDIKVEVAPINKTADTKMGTLVIEVEVVEEGEVAAEAVATVVGKEVAGEEEVHRTLIRGVSLSSISSKGDISTINLDLDKEDTSQVEAIKVSQLAELMPEDKKSRRKETKKEEEENNIEVGNQCVHLNFPNHCFPNPEMLDSSSNIILNRYWDDATLVNTIIMLAENSHNTTYNSEDGRKYRKAKERPH
ncbi:hypothetical protein E2320_019200, partial [Naja naja]